MGERKGDNFNSEKQIACTNSKVQTIIFHSLKNIQHEQRRKCTQLV